MNQKNVIKFFVLLFVINIFLISSVVSNTASPSNNNYKELSFKVNNKNVYYKSEADSKKEVKLFFKDGNKYVSSDFNYNPSNNEIQNLGQNYYIESVFKDSLTHSSFIIIPLYAPKNTQMVIEDGKIEYMVSGKKLPSPPIGIDGKNSMFVVDKNKEYWITDNGNKIIDSKGNEVTSLTQEERNNLITVCLINVPDKRIEFISGLEKKILPDRLINAVTKVAKKYGKEEITSEDGKNIVLIDGKKMFEIDSNTGNLAISEEYYEQVKDIDSEIILLQRDITRISALPQSSLTEQEKLTVKDNVIKLKELEQKKKKLNSIMIDLGKELIVNNDLKLLRTIPEPLFIGAISAGVQNCETSEAIQIAYQLIGKSDEEIKEILKNNKFKNQNLIQNYYDLMKKMDLSLKDNFKRQVIQFIAEGQILKNYNFNTFGQIADQINGEFYEMKLIGFDKKETLIFVPLNELSSITLEKLSNGLLQSRHSELLPSVIQALKDKIAFEKAEKIDTTNIEASLKQAEFNLKYSGTVQYKIQPYLEFVPLVSQMQKLLGVKNLFNDFFDTQFGRVVSGQWDKALCAKYIKKDTSGGIIMSDKGDTTGKVIAHIEATRKIASLKPVKCNSTSDCKASEVCKIQDMEFDTLKVCTIENEPVMEIVNYFYYVTYYYNDPKKTRDVLNISIYVPYKGKEYNIIKPKSFSKQSVGKESFNTPVAIDKICMKTSKGFNLCNNVIDVSLMDPIAGQKVTTENRGNERNSNGERSNDGNLLIGDLEDEARNTWTISNSNTQNNNDNSNSINDLEIS